MFVNRHLRKQTSKAVITTKLAKANETLKGAELIETKRNLLTEKKLELDTLDYEMQEAMAAETKSLRGHLQAESRNAKSPREIRNEAGWCQC